MTVTYIWSGWKRAAPQLPAQYSRQGLATQQPANMRQAEGQRAVDRKLTMQVHDKVCIRLTAGTSRVVSLASRHGAIVQETDAWLCN